MAYFFGDGFDLYAAAADAYQAGTYWDSGSATLTIVTGRFSGSRGLGAVAGNVLRKASGQNDSIHHFNVAHQQTAAISGSTLGFYIQLVDGVTNQCAIVFRSDGAILLTSGGTGGTVLATYTGAVLAQNVWSGFEIEVVVHNTAGSISVRKNGNTSNDFSLGSLNTRGGTANNYANQAQIGSVTSSTFNIDDFLWRSDASSVAWVGDVRCYTRMPASDASVQWSQSGAPSPLLQSLSGGSSSMAISNGVAVIQPFTCQYPGTLTSIMIAAQTGATGNIKAAVWADNAGLPGAVLASVVSQVMVGGNNVFTLSPGVIVTPGQRIWIGACSDTTSTNWNNGVVSGTVALTSSGSFATFPQANPSTATTSNRQLGSYIGYGILPGNYALVQEAQQDAAITYVASSTVGQTDLYGIAPISATPASVVGVTTRALAQKSDVGTRNIGVQLKSGATTSNGTSTALNTTWGWVYRNDLVDPATGAAWTPTAVNNLQIGELLTA